MSGVKELKRNQLDDGAEPVAKVEVGQKPPSDFGVYFVERMPPKQECYQLSKVELNCVRRVAGFAVTAGTIL